MMEIVLHSQKMLISVPDFDNDSTHVTLADCHKSSDPVISRTVLVIKWRITEPMSERVDAECRMMNEKKTSCTSEEEATFPVTPQQTSYGHGKEEAHSHDEGQVVLVLPSNDWVVCKVRNIGNTRRATTFEDHPADV